MIAKNGISEKRVVDHNVVDPARGLAVSQSSLIEFTDGLTIVGPVVWLGSSQTPATQTGRLISGATRLFTLARLQILATSDLTTRWGMKIDAPN